MVTVPWLDCTPSPIKEAVQSNHRTVKFEVFPTYNGGKSIPEEAIVLPEVTLGVPVRSELTKVLIEVCW